MAENLTPGFDNPGVSSYSGANGLSSKRPEDAKGGHHKCLAKRF
jgi:hypothetical protein